MRRCTCGWGACPAGWASRTCWPAGSSLRWRVRVLRHVRRSAVRAERGRSGDGQPSQQHRGGRLAAPLRRLVLELQGGRCRGRHDHRPGVRLRRVAGRRGRQPLDLDLVAQAGSGPDLGGGTLADRRERFRAEYDRYRSGVINEPRGSDVIEYTAHGTATVFTPPPVRACRTSRGGCVRNCPPRPRPRRAASGAPGKPTSER